MVALPSHMTQEVFLRKFHADVIIQDFALENKLLTGAVNTAGPNTKMPRTYVRKKEKKNTEEQLRQAIEKVNEGQKVHQAAKEFGIPTETLRRWIVKPNQARFGSGRTTVLSNEEEELIVVGLQQCARSGWPCDGKDIQTIVKSFLDSMGKVTRFKDNLPGEDWLILFRKRWKDQLTIRKPEILTKSRAEGLTHETVDAFFKLFQETLEQNYMSDALDLAERLHNCDEAGLATNPVSKKVFIPKTEKNAYFRAPSAGKTSYSVLFCISAKGHLCPPFVVYKAKNLYQTWTSGGPQGASYAVTNSGWMEDYVFEEWFLKHYVPWAGSFRKPCILFMDGHGSHLTYKVVKTAKENEIVILCLPPNTSHALQPCDVSLFRPLKAAWKDILKLWFRETRLKAVDKAVFPSLLSKLWLKVKAENAVAGFVGSGLYPINPQKVKPRIVECNAPIQPGNAESHRKLLRQAIINAVTPSPSDSTKSAMANSHRKRKRVQAKAGEVLTDDEVVERLRKEEIARKQRKHQHRKHQKRKGQKVFRLLPPPVVHRHQSFQKEKSRREMQNEVNLCFMMTTQIQIVLN
eukprot:gene11062-19921_t